MARWEFEQWHAAQAAKEMARNPGQTHENFRVVDWQGIQSLISNHTQFQKLCLVRHSVFMRLPCEKSLSAIDRWDFGYNLFGCTNGEPGTKADSRGICKSC